MSYDEKTRGAAAATELFFSVEGATNNANTMRQPANYLFYPELCFASLRIAGMVQCSRRSAQVPQ